MKKIIPLVVAAAALFIVASVEAHPRAVVVRPHAVVVRPVPAAVVVHPVPVCAPRPVTVVHPRPVVHTHKVTRTVTGPLGYTRSRTVVVR